MESKVEYNAAAQPSREEFTATASYNIVQYFKDICPSLREVDGGAMADWIAAELERGIVANNGTFGDDAPAQPGKLDLTPATFEAMIARNALRLADEIYVMVFDDRRNKGLNDLSPFRELITPAIERGLLDAAKFGSKAAAQPHPGVSGSASLKFQPSPDLGKAFGLKDVQIGIIAPTPLDTQYFINSAAEAIVRVFKDYAGGDKSFPGLDMYAGFITRELKDAVARAISAGDIAKAAAAEESVTDQRLGSDGEITRLESKVRRLAAENESIRQAWENDTVANAATIAGLTACLGYLRQYTHELLAQESIEDLEGKIVLRVIDNAIAASARDDQEDAE